MCSLDKESGRAKREGKSLDILTWVGPWYYHFFPVHHLNVLADFLGYGRILSVLGVH